MSTPNTDTGSNVPDVEMGTVSHPPIREPDPTQFLRTSGRTFSVPMGNLNTANKQKKEEDDEVEVDEFRLQDLYEIDVDQILRSLRSDRHFTVKEGYAMTDLPKFDDLTRYGISENIERELWEFEVGRLIDAARLPSPPSLEGHPEWYGTADTHGYNHLHRLAMQIGYALDVCIHDNELLLLEHEPRLATDGEYENAHRRICRIFDQDEGSIRYGRPIKVENNNDAMLHDLINYITAVLIRLLLRSMKGRLWVENCVAVLARFAAKFKVVGTDLSMAFERTLDAHRDCQERVKQASDVRMARNPFDSNGSMSDGDPHAKQQKAFQEEMDSSDGRYFLEMVAFRHPLGELIRAAIVDLKWDEQSEQKADIFETSSMVYHTGFHARRTQLCQERDGAIGATSERRIVDFAGIAFQVAFEIWNSLLKSDDHGGGSFTTVTWSRSPFTEEGSQIRQTIEHSDRHMKLGNMKDVIGALVPYLMYCGSFASFLSSFAKVVMLISDPSNPVRYYRQRPFLTTARITTSEYESLRRLESNSLVRSAFDTDMARKARRGELNNQLQKTLSEVKDLWTIDEKAIIIQHGWYSYISLGVCGLLLAGGVTFIAMGERAKGVDPSNLTALVWAAAGFAMVFFKSLRVQDWPWRDFLRGRVVCRSVSEVVSVTRMDPQHLMAILLHLEDRNILQTRGPFNTLFSRKADDGFSIDKPLMTNTVIDGGYIFVKVDSMSGPALVALKARGWGPYYSISQTDSFKDKEGFICRDFLDPVDRDVNGKEVPLYTLCTNELHWTRVRGIFIKEACFN